MSATTADHGTTPVVNSNSSALPPDQPYTPLFTPRDLHVTQRQWVFDAPGDAPHTGLTGVAWDPFRRAHLVCGLTAEDIERPYVAIPRTVPLTPTVTAADVAPIELMPGVGQYHPWQLFGLPNGEVLTRNDTTTRGARIQQLGTPHCKIEYDVEVHQMMAFSDGSMYGMKELVIGFTHSIAPYTLTPEGKLDEARGAHSIVGICNLGGLLMEGDSPNELWSMSDPFTPHGVTAAAPGEPSWKHGRVDEYALNTGAVVDIRPRGKFLRAAPPTRSAGIVRWPCDSPADSGYVGQPLRIGLAGVIVLRRPRSIVFVDMRAPSVEDTYLLSWEPPADRTVTKPQLQLVPCGRVGAVVVAINSTVPAVCTDAMAHTTRWAAAVVDEHGHAPLPCTRVFTLRVPWSRALHHRVPQSLRAACNTLLLLSLRDGEAATTPTARGSSLWSRLPAELIELVIAATYEMWDI